MKCTTTKNAFTLVELLVVITIIGILISLLLPAVQAAREAARKMRCQNNMKQLGLAVLGYESQWGIFPPSSSWPTNTLASADNYRVNWVILVLPFLEQQPLYDSFDTSAPISGAGSSSNMAARAVELSVMLCPTDSYNRQAFMGSRNSATAAFGDNWARGNYGANAALGWGVDNGPDIRYAFGPTSAGWALSYVRGVMGANCAITMAQVHDGTSNTVLLGEMRAGVTAFDSRGVWALSLGSSALWGTGAAIGCGGYGPNCMFVWSDDIVAGDAILEVFGGSDGLINEGMACGEGGANWQTAPRSMHTGGINTCFADGSIHWISDNIQTMPSTTANLSVWDRIMASADGFPVAGDSY